MIIYNLITEVFELEAEIEELMSLLLLGLMNPRKAYYLEMAKYHS